MSTSLSLSLSESLSERVEHVLPDTAGDGGSTTGASTGQATNRDDSTLPDTGAENDAAVKATGLAALGLGLFGAIFKKRKKREEK